MNQLTVAFALGVVVGICAGPLAVFLVAFYFSSLDRGEKSSRPS